jgi:hypothetical protein
MPYRVFHSLYKKINHSAFLNTIIQLKNFIMNNSRRNFLQKLTASFVAIPFLSNENLANIDKNVDHIFYDGPVLRVAIMGLGSYGTRVADAIQRNSI